MKRRLFFIITLMTLSVAINAQQFVLSWETYHEWSSNTWAVELKDSTVYTHSKSKTSTSPDKAHPINIKYGFDSAYVHGLTPNPKTQTYSLKLQSRLAQTFDNNDSLSMYYSDVYDTAGKVYLNSRMKYAYNSNGMDYMEEDLFMQHLNMYKPYHRTEYVYYPNNKLKEINLLQYDDGLKKYIENKSDSFAYDANGRVRLKKVKEYVAAGGFYNEFSKQTYGYYTNGALASDTFRMSTQIIINTYDYHTSGLLKTRFIITWDANKAKYEPFGKEEYIYDANDNLTEMHDSAWMVTSYAPNRKSTYEYNSYNQLTKKQDSVLNGNYWMLYSYHTLFYWFYTGIAEASSATPSFTLYPVPATTHINLEMDIEEPQNLIIAVIDMQGRMVKQFTDKAHGQYKKNINVQDMPAGQYMLQVKTNGETITRNFTVIR